MSANRFTSIISTATVLTLVSCFLTNCTVAQVRIGLQAGYSRVGWIKSVQSEGHSTSNIDGFQHGLASEFRLSKHWLIRPGLFLSGKGTTLKNESAVTNDTSSRAIRIRYIELPVMLVFRESLSRQLTGFIGAGYFLSYAFRGVEKGSGRRSTEPYEMFNNVDFYPMGNQNLSKSR